MRISERPRIDNAGYAGKCLDAYVDGGRPESVACEAVLVEALDPMDTRIDSPSASDNALSAPVVPEKDDRRTMSLVSLLVSAPGKKKQAYIQSLTRNHTHARTHICTQNNTPNTRAHTHICTQNKTSNTRERALTGKNMDESEEQHRGSYQTGRDDSSTGSGPARMTASQPHFDVPCNAHGCR